MGQLSDLLGPTSDDQEPINISNDYAVVIGGTSTQAAVVDSSGSVYLLVDVTDLVEGPTTSITKLDSNFAESWTAPDLPVGARTLAVTPSGAAYFGGDTGSALPDETLVGGRDAFVGMVDSAGELAWLHQWGSSEHETTLFLSALTDGAVIASGVCAGQAPGNGPDNAGGSFIARYEADGTRAWLKQYPGLSGDPSESFPGPLFVVDDGTMYQGLSDTASPMLEGYVRQIDSTGTLVDDGLISDGTRTLWGLGYVNSTSASGIGAALSADQSGLFTVSSYRSLDFVALDSTLRWYRMPETRTAVIDEVEGIEWTGSFLNIGSVAAADDAVYLTGTYSNDYEFGSVTPPSSTAGFVGRYSLTGERVWFQEFLLNDTTVNVNDIYVGLGQDGNPIIVAASTETFVFRLDKDTGVLL